MTNYSSLLHNRSLVLLGLSETISGIGSWITMMAVLAMLIFRGAGSVLQSSAIFVAGLLPTLLFSPLAGWLCDRLDRKGLMIASELLAGLTVSGLIFVRQAQWIYALVALQAVFSSLMTPARQAVVRDVVAPEELTHANALLQQLAGMVKIGAPMLAGALLAWMDPHTAITLDALSFLASALILGRLPALPPHRLAPASARTSTVTPAESLRLPRLLRRQPDLGLLFTLVFLTIAIIVGFDILAPIYTRDILGESESFFGLAVGLVGLGTLAASIVLMLRKSKARPWVDLLAGVVLLTTIPAALAVGTWLQQPQTATLLIAAACLLGGIGNGLFLIQTNTLLQYLTPPSFMGRVGGIFQSTAVCGQLVGVVLTPALVPARLSLGAFFALAALALGLTVLWMASRRLGAGGEPQTVTL